MKTDIRTLYYFYTSIYRERSEYSKKCADIYFERYIAPYLGERDVKDITPSELQMVLNTLKGKSHTAISIMYGDLMLVMKKAYTDGLTDRDPTGAVMKPKAKATEKRRALTPVEREAVIAVAQTRRQYYAMLFMILCGCRPSEAYKIRKEDIDFERKLVHIRGTKTSHSDRYVPCPDIILALTQNILTGLVTVSQKGLEVGKETQRTIWRSFFRDCHEYLGGTFYRNKPVAPYPFGKDLTAYNLRHEYCTELARNGIDVRITQKLMGHITPEMTLRVYTNLTSEDIDTEDVRKVINKNFRNSQTEKAVVR